MRIGMVKALAAFGLLAGGLVALPASWANAATPASVRSTPIGALRATLADPGATPLDYFGRSVAVSGGTAVIGAPTYSNAGVAYVYVKRTSGWPTAPTMTLLDPASNAYDYFGNAVAVSGGTVAVGAYGTNGQAGAVYLYVKGASGWPTTPTVTLSGLADDAFGISVAMSDRTLVVGAFGTDDGEGSAYIYAKSSSGWSTTPTAILQDPGATTEDHFGDAVTVSRETIAVGASGASSDEGAAYVYAMHASGWPTTPTVTLSDPAETAGDAFGAAAAVSGTTLVVGAPQTNSLAGTTYVYVKRASGWPTRPEVTLQDPGATPGDNDDQFGSSVGLSGEVATIGAPVTNGARGVAYIYTEDTSGWPAMPTVTLSGTEGGDFGTSGAISGETAIVGAYGAEDYQGAAYIYKA